MGPLTGMLSIAGWAFLIGLLGYVITNGQQVRTDAEHAESPDDRRKENDGDS